MKTAPHGRTPLKKPARRRGTTTTQSRPRTRQTRSVSAAAPEADVAITLLQQEARYREFFENANDALALFTPDGRIALVNRAAERLLGYTKEELRGQHYRMVVTPTSAAAAAERSRKALANEALPSRFEVDLVRKDGSVVRVEARDRFVKDDAGTLLGVQGIYRDITERQHAEQSVRESEAKYRTIFTVSPDLMYLTDPTGRIVDANPALLQRTGLTLAQMQQHHVLDFFAGGDPTEVRTQLELLQAGKPVERFEVDARNPDGSTSTYEINAMPIRHGEDIVQALSLARDITDRKAQEHQISKHRELIDRMAATVPDILYTYDLTHKAFVFVNRQIVTILGYTPEQVLNQPEALFRDRVHGADKERVTERDARIARAAEGEVITTEVRLKHANGEWRSLRFRETVGQRAADGTPCEIVGTAHDITEQKWLEDLLRERVLDRTELPTRLKEFRTGLRLSQAQFGALFGGYNQPQISSYEGGDAMIPIGLLLAIRDKGYPVEAVLGGGARDVVSQTATYLPGQHRKKLLARHLLTAALRLLTEDCQTTEALLQGLGMNVNDFTEFTDEPHKTLAQVLQDLDSTE